MEVLGEEGGEVRRLSHALAISNGELILKKDEVSFLEKTRNHAENFKKEFFRQLRLVNVYIYVCVMCIRIYIV